MRSVLILVLAMAFYACVNCEESATIVVKASEPFDASVRGGDRHEDQDRSYKILVKKVDLLRTSLLTHQRQLTESQQQSKMLQDQLQSEKAIVVQLKQQVSKIVDENVKNGVKHQAQDKDYAKLLVAIGQLQSNLTTHEQQLETTQQQTLTLQTQVQSENSTLAHLQQQVTDLNTASARFDQKHQIQDMDYANQLLEIQNLKLNLASTQQQLNDSNLQTTKLQDQLQNKTTAIELLQRQVSDLSAVNVTAVQQIQLLTSNMSSNQQQLRDLTAANVSAVQQIQLLNSTISSNQQQLQDSKELTTSLQTQLDNKTVTINLLQSRVSDLIAANVTAVQQVQQLSSNLSSNQQQLRDLIAANVSATQQIQLLNSTLSSNQQQLQDSKVLTTSLQTQLDNKTVTINLLQSRVSDLVAANVTANQQIQQLNLNVTSQQNQLSVLQQKPAVRWVQWAVEDTIPKDAVLAGQNSDSSPIYVGRTLYNGVYCVVKACPTLRSAFFSYYGQELTVASCEVLTGSDFYWQWGTKGSVPDNGVSSSPGGGRFVGRAHYSNGLHPGTVDRGGALFLGYSGKEYAFDAYQVLCHN